MAKMFSRAASWTAQQCGRPGIFLAALATIVIWAAAGPVYHYSDTWQLIINTGTTIITFLMVFLIQNTQNRDTAAIQLKLDELIRANKNARNIMLGLEDLSEDELRRLKQTFASLAAAAEAVADVGGNLEAASDALESAASRTDPTPRAAGTPCDAPMA